MQHLEYELMQELPGNQLLKCYKTDIYNISSYIEIFNLSEPF